MQYEGKAYQIAGTLLEILIPEGLFDINTEGRPISERSLTLSLALVFCLSHIYSFSCHSLFDSGIVLSYRSVRSDKPTGRYYDPMPIRFLIPIDCSKIPALLLFPSLCLFLGLSSSHHYSCFSISLFFSVVILSVRLWLNYCVSFCLINCPADSYLCLYLCFSLYLTRPLLYIMQNVFCFSLYFSHPLLYVECFFVILFICLILYYMYLYVPETNIMYLTYCCWFLKIPRDCCCLGGGGGGTGILCIYYIPVDDGMEQVLGRASGI